MKINKSLLCLVFLSLFHYAHAQQDSIPLLIANDSLIISQGEQVKADQIYRLEAAIDVPLTALGIGWSVFAFTKIYSKEPSTEQQILDLDKNDIPKIDRWAAGKTDETADKNSDYLFYGSIPAPFLLFVDKKIRHDGAKISFMYLEAMAITGLLYTGSVYFIDRYRPETYNTTLPMEERKRGNNKDAFIAGHPALVATATFFTAKVYADYHPDSKFKYVLYGVAIATTGTTAYLRHLAGKHFPTDLLTGITIGTLSGILVPQLHKNKTFKPRNLSTVPFSNGNIYGITMIYAFQ